MPTVSAIAEFQSSSTIEKHTKPRKGVHSIEKKKRSVKPRVKRKSRKRFKDIFDNMDTDRIEKLSRMTFALGVLAVGLTLIAVVADVFFLYLMVLAVVVAGLVLGIISLTRIKKSSEDHKRDKNFTVAGMILSFLPVVAFIVLLIFFLLNCC